MTLSMSKRIEGTTMQTREREIAALAQIIITARKSGKSEDRIQQLIRMAVSQ
jgi:hypothetical protein